MSDDGESVISRPQSPPSAIPDALPTPRPYRFNWDPSSRKPGPESVSGTTEGRGGGDYFSAQPRIIIPATSSTVALPLGTLPQDWSSAKHGFHAISTVLNHPHKRQAPPKAHSTLSPVIPAVLPRVRRKDFDPYLRTVTPEWERFQHNTQLGKEGIAQISEGSSKLGDSKRREDENGATSPPSADSIPPLDSVPPVFFERNFDLGDPLVFRAITEECVPADTNFLALADSLPLLEKFSSYADTVEQHLIHEISLRSTSFFAALTNLHDLQSESEHCLTQIASLRKSLRNLDENSAKRGLELVKHQARADNLLQVIDGVKVIGGIMEMSRVAKSLVAAGQWGEALSIIEALEKLWNGRSSEQDDSDNEATAKLAIIQEEGDRQGEQQDESRQSTPSSRHGGSSTSSSMPLSSLHAYASLPNHLQTLSTEIATSLSSELVLVLRTDMAERMNRSRDPSDAPQGLEEKRAMLDQGLKDRIRPLVQGLERTGGLKAGILAWREEVLVEVRGVVKARLPMLEVEEDDVGSKRRTNGNGVKSRDATPRSSFDKLRNGMPPYVRGMDQPEFMLLLQDIYQALLNLVEGLQRQGQIIEEILGRSKESSSSTTNATPTMAIQDDLVDVLSSATELAHSQAAKVIAVRTEEHATLELAEFLVFFNQSWNFVVRCEVICRRMIVGLRGVVVSQAKLFLQAFHQARLTRSAKIVEDEQWNPAEITPALQHITNIIINSAVCDCPELVIKSETDTLPTDASVPNATAALNPLEPRLTNGFPVSATANAKHLRIEERTYFAVSATTEVLALLLDYLRLVVNLTMLTTDSMSRVIEFLKAFNSRTCQVVLGAGAMRSAGLRNITAKHLALASQSLSIMSELIPYVRETFRRHLSLKQAVMLVEFDKLKRDYQEHQNEIHSKLIAIMGDRLTAHIKTLQAIDWNVPKAEGGVNEYMEILVKETVTLHKVLSRYLSTQVVEYVMTQVFAAINHGLSEEYGKIELPHQEAKTRLLEDAKYLHQKLSTLKNVGMPSSMLVTVVQEKSLPRPPGAPRSPSPLRTSTFQSVGANANQRLKGLLLKSPTVDKALPMPDVPVRAEPLSPQRSPEKGAADLTGGKAPSRRPTPPPKHSPAMGTPGFKEVSDDWQAPSAGPECGSGSVPDREGETVPEDSEASDVSCAALGSGVERESM